MNHGIIIHPEDFNDLKSMSAEECGHIIQNMIKTFHGESVVPFADRYLTRVSNDMCGRVIRDKEMSERQSRNGSKGGAKEGHPNYNKPKLSQSLPKVKPKLNPNTNTNTNTNTNINKRLYGECQNVKLTEDEYNKLVEKNYTGLIDELSLYIASKGDKYKSHYATILQWAKKREKETLGTIPFKPKEKPYQQMMKSTYDMDALEKKLIKN